MGALVLLAVIDFLNINPAFSPDGRRLVFESTATARARSTS